MESSYKELLHLAQVRRTRLEESLALQMFYRDVDEEELWISEKDTFLSSTDYGHDLNTTMLLLKKDEVMFPPCPVIVTGGGGGGGGEMGLELGSA